MFFRQFYALPFICLVEPFLRCWKKGRSCCGQFYKGVLCSGFRLRSYEWRIIFSLVPLFWVSSYDWSPTTVCSRIHSSVTRVVMVRFSYPIVGAQVLRDPLDMFQSDATPLNCIRKKPLSVNQNACWEMFFYGWSGRSMKLITALHPAPRLCV
jgi:hypothetical protein